MMKFIAGFLGGIIIYIIIDYIPIFKNIKDNTEFYLCIGNLKRGIFNNISIIENIANKADYLKYKTN